MSLINDTLKAKIAQAKAVGPNMTEASKGGSGGGYTPPAAGKAVRLRLVGYYELGTHVEQTGQFAGKKNKKVSIVWELSGKNWEPKEADGKKIPQRMTQTMNYSLHEKAKFFQMFSKLRAAHGNTATTFPELLGTEYLGDIEHNKSGDAVYANLVNIRKAERENDEGEIVPVSVPAPLSDIKLFLWDFADLEMWDSLFIDGEYPERKDKEGKVVAPAKSKNVLQEKIKSALDWHTCPIAALVDGRVSKEDEQGLDKVISREDDVPVSGDEPDLDLI